MLNLNKRKMLAEDPLADYAEALDAAPSNQEKRQLYLHRKANKQLTQQERKDEKKARRYMKALSMHSVALGPQQLRLLSKMIVRPDDRRGASGSSDSLLDFFKMFSQDGTRSHLFEVGRQKQRLIEARSTNPLVTNDWTVEPAERITATNEAADTSGTCDMLAREHVMRQAAGPLTGDVNSAEISRFVTNFRRAQASAHEKLDSRLEEAVESFSQRMWLNVVRGHDAKVRDLEMWRKVVRMQIEHCGVADPVYDNGTYKFIAMLERHELSDDRISNELFKPFLCATHRSVNSLLKEMGLRDAKSGQRKFGGGEGSYRDTLLMSETAHRIERGELPAADANARFLATSTFYVELAPLINIAEELDMEPTRLVYVVSVMAIISGMVPRAMQYIVACVFGEAAFDRMALGHGNAVGCQERVQEAQEAGREIEDLVDRHHQRQRTFLDSLP